MNAKVHAVLEDADKQISRCVGTNGLLAKAFRQILIDRDICDKKWERLMADHLIKTVPRNSDNPHARTSVRGNLTKELFRPYMTWKVFFKGIRFLQALEMTIYFKIKWSDLKTIYHELPVTDKLKNAGKEDVYPNERERLKALTIEQDMQLTEYAQIVEDLNAVLEKKNEEIERLKQQLALKERVV